jgi:hypothetical protein
MKSYRRRTRMAHYFEEAVTVCKQLVISVRRWGESIASVDICKLCNTSFCGVAILNHDPDIGLGACATMALRSRDLLDNDTGLPVAGSVHKSPKGAGGRGKKGWCMGARPGVFRMFHV